MSARMISMGEVNQLLYRYLKEKPLEGLDEAPLLISRRGRIVGVSLRIELWERVREAATAPLDMAQVEEFADRVATLPAERTTLAELFPEGGLTERLGRLEVSVLPYLRSDLRAAYRAAKDLRNLAGFSAHLARGYLRGSEFAAPSGEVFFREVVPAYWDEQVPFRLVWHVPGAEQEPVIVAVSALSGEIAACWEYPSYMDATEAGTEAVLGEQS
ncbi:hypothetical protein KRX56_01650 [Dermabacteraceae bacterium TAE3-ERU27]|nr:hypothetical protein [Dermabacteraceae bacterium TAE3-ERU27]